MIKVIVFDYAGVVAQGPGNWIKNHINPKDDQEYKNASRKWDSGEINTEQAKVLLGKLTNTPPEMIWENFYENTISDKKILSLITKLKLNYKIFLFSNFMADMLRALLKKHQIENLFDEVIISSDYGLVKPQEEFFDVLVEKANAEKNEIIFVDDLKENVDAGNKYGIKSFVYSNFNKLSEDLKSAGVYF